MPSAGGRLKGIVLSLLRFGIAGGIIIWMVSMSLGDLVVALESFNLLWLFPAGLLYVLHLFAGAWRWSMLLEVQGIRIRFMEALSLSMQGFFFSLILPGGAVGGDVAKAAFLIKRSEKGSRLAGTFTILIDRVIGLISLFLVAGIAGIVCYRLLENVTGLMTVIVYAMLFGCLSGLVSGVLLFFHRQLERLPGVGLLIRLGDRMTRGSVSRLVEAMDSFRSAWRTLLAAIGISVLLIHLMLTAVVFCIAKGLDVESNSAETYVLSTTLANAASAIPATPSGIGTRDIVMQQVLVSSGVPEVQALAVALIFTGIILFFNLAGGLFFVFGGPKKNLKTILGEE